MLTRDLIAARMTASALMATQAEAIGAAVHEFGAEAYASMLRELADMIEAGEFPRERMH